ncbi:hypothetical protein [Planomonospora sp. ID82291]|uniref:hypothetical protein n=1 Tax=Planomonospora sp. ID82291 TaxID=2738136 RepID=UPI0018C3EE01|nr:hypothetical protein [Planomonospora sp. ID82291]MBG0817427.1 hypothetical protein [Planomonospora sp. ID82291]
MNQAAVKLKADIERMAQHVRAENFKLNDTNGKSLPCGEGKAKRVYEASGTMGLKSSDVTASLGVLTYKLDDYGYESKQSDLSIPKEDFENQTAHTKITATTSPESRFKILGETDCLDLE